MQRGFSLVETIVATGLLMAVLLSVAQVMFAAVWSGAQSRARTTCVLLGQQKLEELRSRSWNDLQSKASGASGSIEYLDAPGGRYVRTWSAVPASFNPGILYVEVRVTPVESPDGGATFVSARSRKTQ